MSAYACRPKGGSEPGAGWAWAKAAARDHDVWLLTRGKFAHEIEEELAIRPVPGLTVVPLELSKFLLKCGVGRGRVLVLPAVAAQGRPGRRAVARQQAFDVIHHLTFAVDWMPAGVVRRTTAKVIWGPVGGSTAVPLSMAHWLGSSGLVGSWSAARGPASPGDWSGGSPRSAPTWSLPRTRMSPRVLGRTRARSLSSRMSRSPFASASGPYDPSARRAWDGAVRRPLDPWKGLLLAMSALARPRPPTGSSGSSATARLVPRRRLAEKLGVRDRVEFTGQLPARIAPLLRADALLAPALREAAAWAVTEALASGCPVVCVDRGGPSVIVGPDEGVAVNWRGDVVGEAESPRAWRA